MGTEPGTTITSLSIAIPSLATDLFSVTGPDTNGDYIAAFYGDTKSAEYQALIDAGDTTHPLTVGLSDSDGATSVYR